jgi:hypothetical protein
MNRSEQDRLLREILDEGDTANFRAASLARGLDMLQQRKRRHRLTQACATAIVPCLLISALVFHQLSRSSPTSPSVAPALATGADTAKVKIINDEELFALFPNRAMALIGSPGQQQLVFLDHDRASEQP